MTSADSIGCESGEQTKVFVGTIRQLHQLAAYALQAEARPQHRTSSSQIVGRNGDIDAAEAAAGQHVVCGGSDRSFQGLRAYRSTPAERR